MMPNNPILLFVAPNKELAKKTNAVVKRNNWDKLVIVKIGNNHKGVELVHRYYKRGIRYVISRGGTFKAIQECCPKLAIVKDVGTDTAVLLLQYQKLSKKHGKVAISCADSLLPPQESIDAAVEKGLIKSPTLIRHREPGHPELTRKEILKDMKDFRKAGGKLVICDTFAAKVAKKAGLNSRMVETTKQQIEACIRKNLQILKHAFVAMPFTNNYDKDDVYCLAIKPALQNCDFVPFRADEDTSGQHITQLVEQQIQESFLIIADISNGRPNCYYELGYARAIGKKIILIMKKGNKAHFDVYDLPRIEYDQCIELKECLEKRIKEICNVEDFNFFTSEAEGIKNSKVKGKKRKIRN